MPDHARDACLLTDLVRIPSVSQSEADASAFFVDWMRKNGFSAHVDGVGNAVGVRGDGEREILLLGHIDTVPGEIPVREDGGRLFGRGTVDAKGPLCAFAAAAARVEPPSGWRVTVVGAVEEEIASSRGARHVVQTRRGSPPTFCVIGEPSRWDRITLGYKGRLVLNAAIRAPMAHTAGEGSLPAEIGVDLWNVVVSWCVGENQRRDATREFDRMSPTLQKIASTDDGTHGRVTLTVGYRLPVGDDPDDVAQRLEAQVVRALDRHHGLEATYDWIGGEIAHRSSKSTPLVRASLRAIRENGGTPRFVVKSGTSDMNVVAPHWPDTPIVAYGPGDSALDHTPDEHLELEEYHRAIAILRTMLSGLMTLPSCHPAVSAVTS